MSCCFGATLYHQIITTVIMKTINRLIETFRALTGPTKKTPPLIAISQECFCANLAIQDYYCDEINLFI
ncbi:hypothetical protein [Flavobacterium faecale]|uniref:hypothetical protein n=1 Tax=Flavobacterium faecale TaxID=1355330 RepID=UPI003AAEE10F